jgi:hypothetical protein
MPDAPSITKTESWENEGGALGATLPEDIGITRLNTVTYEVGGYRYTQLADAIAQARRMRQATSND